MLMQLNTVQWISLPIEIRNRLKNIFDIPRSGHTEVEDNVIITDGYTHPDLAHITVEKMQAFLLDTTETEYFRLFHRVLDAIREQIEEESKPTIDPNIPLDEPEVVEPLNIKIEITNEQTKETEQVKGTDTKRVRTKTRTNTKKS